MTVLLLSVKPDTDRLDKMQILPGKANMYFLEGDVVCPGRRDRFLFPVLLSSFARDSQTANFHSLQSKLHGCPAQDKYPFLCVLVTEMII